MHICVFQCHLPLHSAITMFAFNDSPFFRHLFDACQCLLSFVIRYYMHNKLTTTKRTWKKIPLSSPIRRLAIRQIGGLGVRIIKRDSWKLWMDFCKTLFFLFFWNCRNVFDECHKWNMTAATKMTKLQLKYSYVFANKVLEQQYMHSVCWNRWNVIAFSVLVCICAFVCACAHNC